MSQIFKPLTSSGPIPPIIPTSFVTDVNSPAIPALNRLDVFGRSLTINNTNGIQTDGSSGSNVLTVQLTNRITGSGTTVDGTTPVVIYTFPLGGVAGVYQFTTNVVGYNSTDNIGAGYSSYRTVRTDGAAGTLIDATIVSIGEEGTMIGVSVVNGLSGNSLTLAVEGLAGKNIDWFALTTYIFVS